MSLSRTRRWRWVVFGGCAAALGACLLLGFLPAPEDPYVAPEDYGAGAPEAAAGDAGTGDRLPPLPQGSPAQERLGYLLFFDPVLSGEDDIACATCHHPDLAFADGRARAMGAGGHGLGPARAGGLELARSAPSLWNVGYAASLFWDGRAPDLETQAVTPLTAPDEMGADLESMAAELRAIPEYAQLFDEAFGGGAEAVTAENTARALAAFQRTLLAVNTPYDRYAAGDLAALTPAQRRGLALFRSAATGCYACHAAPTFGDGAFRRTGAPALAGEPADPGREGATGVEEDRYLFKTPSLRNIALSAPYMHNGSLAKLEEVVAFYAGAGAREPEPGAPRLDRRLRGFELTAQEAEDLIAFLYALTDESGLPPIPDAVPSGLPVAPPLDNPARQAIAAHLAPGSPQLAPGQTRQPIVIEVLPGQSIQAAVDAAGPGDTIEIAYGTYREKVIVDLDDFTLRGVPNAAGEWPVLDGGNEFTDAIVATGDNFTVERLHIANYRANGVIVEGAHNVTFRDLYVENAGLYGVYPVHATGVLVERVEVTGVRDAGIYAGQARDVVIRDSRAHGNVIGIEVENTVNAEVYGNHTYNNAAGIFISMLPQLTARVSRHTRIYGNLTEDNNHPNFAQAGETAALVPSGTGILILGGDDVEIFANEVGGNGSAGIAVFSTAAGFDAATLDIGPNPERIRVHGNTFTGNGQAPDRMVSELGLYGADILWDASSWDVTWEQPGASSFPPVLPGANWPDFARRAYWRALSAVIAALG